MAGSKKRRTPQTQVERVFLMYLERTPMSYALWRTLEYKALGDIEFKAPVLDLGCGEGLFSSILFAPGIATGMDINIKDAAQAKSLGTHCGVVVGDGCKLPFGDAAFETVFSNCVIEHIPDVKTLLAEVSRALKPGGRFVCTVPGERFTPNLYFVRLFGRLGLGPLARAYGGFMNRMLGHVHQLTHSEWAALLESAGLAVEISRPLIPASAVRIFDLGIYSAYRSYLNRILFRRWTIAPGMRKWWAPRLFAATRHLLDDNADLGGGLLLTARKPEA